MNLIPIFLLFFLYNYCKTQSTAFSSKQALNCLKINTYNNLLKGEKIIGNASTCHNVGKQCCFINITHYYGSYLLKEEFCNFLNVNITTFQNFLYNMYNDDEMYYANFTAHNLDMYRTIGRNLNQSLTSTLDCYLGPKQNSEYSKYVDKNCKRFEDGVCTGVKNGTRFDQWISGFHSGYADAYCNKKQDNGKKCIRNDGAMSNDKMVRPLLEELRDYLQADNDEYIVTNNESNIDINPDFIDDEGLSSYLPNWTLNGKFIKNCKARPNVTVEVICPEGYVGQKYLEFYYIYLILIFLYFSF